MKTLKQWILVLVMLSLPFAQTAWAVGSPGDSSQSDGLKVTVSGVVVDTHGEALIGASVIQKGTDNGTITDLDGRFSLNVPTGATLIISSIGYLDTEVAATQGMKVILKENISQLEEVVVVGYGTMKKKDLTGAISQVRTEQMEKEAPRSVTDLLRGGVAGVERCGEDPNRSRRLLFQLGTIYDTG